VNLALRFLSRVLPARLQQRPELPDPKRRELLATVGDHDPCLRVVLDLQQETLAHEFYAAIDLTRTDGERLRACEGMRVAFYNLKRLEEERAAAIEWRRQAAAGE
jgi:hypothetical protein